jgi:hypothetical protein
MALDFVQMDDNGVVTQVALALDRSEHLALLRGLHPATCPLLAHRHDYFDDARFGLEELPELEREILLLRERAPTPELAAVVEGMLAVVQDSVRKRRAVEAIAD